MRGRLPLFMLLASALTLLTSLFLPWREVQGSPASVGSPPQPTVLGGGQVDGWVTGVGDVAVVLVVAIVLATIAALRRRTSARLPIATLSVALAYFVAAVAVEVRRLSEQIGGFTGVVHIPHSSWTYGFYLGIASGAVAMLSGLAFRWKKLVPPRGAADVAAGVLGIALLISFLLPWLEFDRPANFPGYPGTVYAAVVIAALGLIFGAPRLHRSWRLPLAIATAILAGGAASATSFDAVHGYGTWIGIACAVSLAALETVRAWPLRLPTPPRRLAALRVSGAALLIVALFLPWQELGPYVTNGWYVVPGAAAGGLCLLLIATPACPDLEEYAVDFVVAIALFVSALGTAFREDVFIRIGYGAFVGFAAAGILLVVTLIRLRPGRIERARAVARAVPLAASVLCVAAVVVPLWSVLPRDWTYQANPLDGWMAVPGLLLALYLVRLWVLRTCGTAITGDRLALVPIALLTLASLELIRFRNDEVDWGAVILVGLCLLLAVFGWIDERRGLDTFRIPEEIWRIDRLPEPES